MGFIEALLVVISLFGGGVAVGYNVKDDAPDQILQCPTVIKPDPIKKLRVVDCITECDKDVIVKINRETRGEIDRFAKDCRSYEKTVNQIIDKYNDTISKESTRLKEKR